jgi:tetratricopeptide (TPR) repeat protein
MRLSKQAVELDPLNPTAHMIRAGVFTLVDRFEDAEQAYLKTLELSPDMTAVRWMYSTILLRQGRLTEALEMAEKEKLTGYRACALAIVNHGLGRQADSDRALAMLIGEGEQWGIQIALVYGYRGEVDKAFEWLERSYELRDSGMPLTKVSPFLRSLHSDPRWPVFLKKIGLAD